MNKICIIGGGPAGMLAAIAAGSLNKDVTLYEKNEKLGKKLFITGKGRCNITNASEIDLILENIVSNREFMYSGLYTFSNDSIVELLEGQGLKTKIERGNRVFPSTDKSSDVIAALSRELKKNKVKVNLNSRVDLVEKKDNLFIIEVNGVKEEFDSLIIATGGKSYTSTGSTGDGYKFAKKLGHSIIKPRPGLCPINLFNFDKELQGLSLKNVELVAYYDKKEYKRLFGEMLFSHFGISGPIALTMSSFINNLEKDRLALSIDLKPNMDFQKLDRRILKDFEKYQNKILSNALDDLLPKKLINSVILQSGIKDDKVVHQITKEERSKLIDSLKNYRLNFKSVRDLDYAIITAGGVDTLEINPSTMESKLIENLYFAGEAIDLDALTGGYNLQIAYSTGYLAGLNA